MKQIEKKKQNRTISRNEIVNIEKMNITKRRRKKKREIKKKEK